MNIFLKRLALGMFVSSVVMASEGTTTEEPETSANTVSFQVIEKELTFNHHSIKSAVAVPAGEGSEFYNIDLELTPAAAKQFEQLTGNNLNKKLNIIVNDELVSSSFIASALKERFMISGLTKAQATRFEENFKHGH
ncbi:MAG: hypothetical protein P1U61_04055 [Legionellaceae bacterium]|nr:hypothetical protein [Legionellaceae bacterium]